jgi:hypothetical protein
MCWKKQKIKIGNEFFVTWNFSDSNTFQNKIQTDFFKATFTSTSLQRASFILIFTHNWPTQKHKCKTRIHNTYKIQNVCTKQIKNQTAQVGTQMPNLVHRCIRKFVRFFNFYPGIKVKNLNSYLLWRVVCVFKRTLTQKVGITRIN